MPLSHPPWGAALPPSSSLPSPAPPPPSQTPPPPQFTSSFGAFGLPQPRAGVSNLTMQLERAGGGGAAQPLGTFGSGGGSGAQFGTGAASPGPVTSNAAGAGTPSFGAQGLTGSALFGGPPTTSPYLSFPVNATGPRRPSMLAGDATMMESSDDDDEAMLEHMPHRRGQGGGVRRRRPPPPPADETMMSLSPAYESAVPQSHPFASTSGQIGTRRSRSRSTSESGGVTGTSSSLSGFSAALAPGLFPFANVPPSPVTIARALQATGQKTPPPFLQRRLFKDDSLAGPSARRGSSTTSAGSGSAAGGEGMMQEDSASGRSSRSGSSSEIGQKGPTSAEKGKGKARTLASALLDEDEEIEELSVSLSRSASAGPGSGGEDGDRAVRRPVSRRPNLLPKPKSHLRILTELRTEAAPGDQSEIASEATLHRLSRAGAAAPALRSSCPPSMDTRPAISSSSSSSVHPATSTAGTLATGSTGAPKPKPPPNRFPEQAAEDDDLLFSHGGALSSSSSNDGEPEDVAEAGSDWGGMSVGYGTEDDEERRSNVVWNGIRSGPGGAAVTVAVPAGVGRSPGTGEKRNGGMDVEFATPQTPTAFTARPGKRKINDDRFEPYAHQALKRRAVSPAASLSLSPGFHASSAGGGVPSSSSSAGSKHPTPPPLPSSSLSITTSTRTQPVAIPSPTSGTFPPSSLLATSSGSQQNHHQFFSALSGSASLSHLSAGQPGTTGTRSMAASPSTSLSSSAGGGRGFSSFVMSERHRPISVREEMERMQREMRVEPEEIGRMSLGRGRGGGEEEEEL
ncbi:hypothetical protein JCM11251_002096 [Rhodosporidiobolus azoricus]